MTNLEISANKIDRDVGGTPALGFPVIGIHASAGGAEAVAEMFQNIHQSTGMAYVLMGPPASDHDRFLADLVGRQPNIKLCQVSDGAHIEADCLHLIPIGVSVRISQAVFRLAPVSKLVGFKEATDRFFLSLAEAQNGLAGCVVLSAPNSDGSNALRAVKERGGLCVVQKPVEAGHDSMPVPARSTDFVDFTLKAQDIIPRLCEVFDHRRNPAPPTEANACSGQRRVRDNRLGETPDDLRAPQAVLRRKLDKTDAATKELPNINAELKEKTDASPLTCDERAEYEMLIGEMGHRIKNLFAVVNSLLQLAPKTSDETKAFCNDMTARIASLGRAYDLVGGNGALSSIDMAGLFHKILDPHIITQRVRLDGPPLTIGGDAINALTLVIHEMTTNAVKYGCFSKGDGRLDVDWTRDGESSVAVTWSEHVPGFEQPEERQGFGSRVIQMGLLQLNGQMQRELTANGMQIRIDLDLAKLAP